MREADFVIVGAGSAGCAMAYRLSEDGKHTVIVIEHGGTDYGPLIQMPSALSIPMFFSSLGVRLNGPKADGKRIVVNWTLTDTGEKYVLNLENSTLTYVAGRTAETADAGLTLERATLTKVMQQKTTFPEAIGAGLVKIAGDPSKLLELFGLFDTFDLGFAIAEP